MKQRRRIYYSAAAQRSEIWDRWQAGEAMSSIGRRGGLATWQMRIDTQHIEEHLSEQISLLTLADLARLSQSHFSRAFKQSFSVPPHEYHIQRRIEKAKALLAEREASITDVGFALGYSHTSSFSVAFRKVTGRSPTEFRRLRVTITNSLFSLCVSSSSRSPKLRMAGRSAPEAAWCVTFPLFELGRECR